MTDTAAGRAGWDAAIAAAFARLTSMAAAARAQARQDAFTAHTAACFDQAADAVARMGEETGLEGRGA